MKKAIAIFVLIVLVLMFSKPAMSQSRYGLFLPLVTAPHGYAIDCIDQHGHFVECGK
jgi:hypothetical protein